MNTKMKVSFYLLLFGLISEIIGPFIFQYLTPHYNSLRQLISDFGVQGARTQRLFSYWGIMDGCLILAGTYGVYFYFKKTQPTLAFLLALGIGLFAIGDCLFTAIFHRETGESISWKAYLHDGGSGVGFAAFYGGLLCLFFLYQLANQKNWSFFILGNLILAGIFMIIFALPRVPFIHIDETYRGLYQRGNLFFMYLPYIAMTVICLKT